MSLPANLPAALLETILTRLAVLFITTDQASAREAATQLLSAYHPETQEELCVAAEIISFSLQSLGALGESCEPGLPVNRVLRLRSGAVSLSRERHKAQRQLETLRKARRQAAQPQPEQTPEPTIQDVFKPNPKPARAETEAEIQTNARIAASIKRAEAKFGIASPSATPASAIALRDATSPGLVSATGLAGPTAAAASAATSVPASHTGPR